MMQESLAALAISCSPEQMLLQLPVGPDGAWGWLAIEAQNSVISLLSFSPPFLYSSSLSSPSQVSGRGIIPSLLACLYDASQHLAPIRTSDHLKGCLGRKES